MRLEVLRGAGTAAYMAPELLQKGKMTRAADVYSFAMIMVELFTCKRLFEGLAQQQVVSRVCNAYCLCLCDPPSDAPACSHSFGRRVLQPP